MLKSAATKIAHNTAQKQTGTVPSTLMDLKRFEFRNEYVSFEVMIMYMDASHDPR